MKLTMDEKRSWPPPHSGAPNTINTESGQPICSSFGGNAGEKYLLLSKIGSGGYGEVWEAKDTESGRAVAIKLFSKQPAGRDAHYDKRISREIRAAARLDHPNIVKLLDHGTTSEGLRYIVFEMLKGRTLREHLKSAGILPVQDALKLMLGVAKALAKIAKANLVHRDLKPDNIFLVDDEDGSDLPRAVVIDFGVVKVSDALTDLTREGAHPGTPIYMSPEQITGHTLSPASDLYVMGCILYEAVTGQRPYAGEEGVGDEHGHVGLREYIAPSKRNPDQGIPHAVDLLIADLMAKTPGHRAGSAHRDKNLADLPFEVVQRIETIHQELAKRASGSATSGQMKSSNRWTVPNYDPTPPTLPAGARHGRGAPEIVSNGPQLGDQTHVEPLHELNSHSRRSSPNRPVTVGIPRAAKWIALAGLVAGALTLFRLGSDSLLSVLLEHGLITDSRPAPLNLLQAGLPTPDFPAGPTRMQDIAAPEVSSASISAMDHERDDTGNSESEKAWMEAMAVLPRAGLVSQLMGALGARGVVDIFGASKEEIARVAKRPVRSDVRPGGIIQKYVAPSGEESYVYIESRDAHVFRVGTFFSQRKACNGLPGKLGLAGQTIELKCGGSLMWYALGSLRLQLYIPVASESCSWYLYARELTQMEWDEERSIANAFACNDAAVTLWRDKKPQEALDMFRIALQILPGYGKAALRACEAATALDGPADSTELCNRAKTSGFPEVKECIATIEGKRAVPGARLCL